MIPPHAYLGGPESLEDIQDEREAEAKEMMRKAGYFDAMLETLKELVFRANLAPEDEWLEAQALGIIAKAEGKA